MQYQKHLPEGTYLYKGAVVKINKTADNKNKTNATKKQLKSIAAPKPNKFILGFPYKVAIWNVIGTPKHTGGFRDWLRNRLGEPPVFSTMVNLSANATNMNEYLINKGYFKAATSSAKK